MNTTTTPLYRRRKRRNQVVMAACLVATGIGFLFLFAILFTLVSKGISSISLSIFTERTRMTDGGLGNAIWGTLVMTSVATVFGTIIGVAAGTWLAEYGGKRKTAKVIRFINDVLLSAPSIIVGLFIYAVVVVPMGNFSAWAGVLSLTVIIVPVVIRSTEDMMQLIPNSLREAAAALGAHRWWIIVRVCYSGARAGIMTGILLGFARISGETAPLLFTSLNSNQWNFFQLNNEMANLPMTIYQNMTINAFIPDLVSLAWAGALILTAAILILNIAARYFSRQRS
ncbi:phosphate ABC transporter permease PstA [Salinicola aestuarinus]|uniref:phosphate ABC transporter permease PstA n=1 Tax=Salinicola aestuarinus TaxID=1949082 RepID=UPI000DA203C5|nr:phosphate ABC transporter permease PstA [Salinicola aestuarinus]